MVLNNGSKPIHYVLRALKTSRSCSSCQTYDFESKIAQGIQKWVQNNQLPALPSNVFFKKLFSEQKKSSKNWRFCWFLNFSVNINAWVRPILTNLNAGLSESVKILPKCWKLFNFFTCDFSFLKISCFIVIIATLGFSGPQTDDFQKWKGTFEKIEQFSTFW